MVRESRLKYDEYILVPIENELDSHHRLLDLDDDDQESGYFGAGFEPSQDGSKDHKREEKRNYAGSSDGDDMKQYLQDAKKA